MLVRKSICLSYVSRAMFTAVKFLMRTAAEIPGKAHSLCGTLLCCLAAACLAFGGASVAQAHRSGPQSGTPVLLLPRPLFSGAGTIGDFDGDREADYAFAHPVRLAGRSNRHRIQVHLSGHPSTTIELEAGIAGGLRIAALDIDRDKDLDLVITTRFGDPLGVWINDGHGT